MRPALSVSQNLHPLTRSCRFASFRPLVRAFDFVVQPPLAVNLLDTDGDKSELPLVKFSVNGSAVMGFIDRDCLGAPRPGLSANINALFLPQISPSLFSVLASPAQLEMLGVGSLRLGAGALNEIRQLTLSSSVLRWDAEALREISQLLDSKLRRRSLESFLQTSQVDLGDWIRLGMLSASEGEKIRELSREALFLSFLEFKKKDSRCALIRNATRLLFLTGAVPTTSDEILAYYAIVYGTHALTKSEEVSCGDEFREARTLLIMPQFPQPRSPYLEDQTWKQAWGVPTDEDIKRAFGTKRVRVIRDDGDLYSEKRVVADIGVFGRLEEYTVRKNAQAEYRWLQKPKSKEAAKSTEELRRRLR